MSARASSWCCSAHPAPARRRRCASLSGLETASSGRVRIGARDVTDILPKYRDISMVFQSYALYPHKTVAENIGFPLKVRKVEKAEMAAAIREAAAQVQLGGLLDRYPRQLSGGQRQRVALARAIIRRPSVFLMDEPLSNLDAKLRGHMRAELKHMQYELGITTIYVTHDQIEAMTLAHRVALLEGGRLQQLDTPGQHLQQPDQPVRRPVHRLAANERDEGDARRQHLPRRRRPHPRAGHRQGRRRRSRRPAGGLRGRLARQCRHQRRGLRDRADRRPHPDHGQGRRTTCSPSRRRRTSLPGSARMSASPWPRTGCSFLRRQTAPA